MSLNEIDNPRGISAEASAAMSSNCKRQLTNSELSTPSSATNLIGLGGSSQAETSAQILPPESSDLTTPLEIMFFATALADDANQNN